MLFHGCSTLTRIANCPMMNEATSNKMMKHHWSCKSVTTTAAGITTLVGGGGGRRCCSSPRVVAAFGAPPASSQASLAFISLLLLITTTVYSRCGGRGGRGGGRGTFHDNQPWRHDERCIFLCKDVRCFEVIRRRYWQLWWWCCHCVCCTCGREIGRWTVGQEFGGGVQMAYQRSQEWWQRTCWCELGAVEGWLARP